MKEIDKLEDTEDNDYTDILNYPHYESQKYPHLSMASRAGQFSPFAALSGYDDQIKEAERVVLSRIELTEEAKENLDRVISTIKYNDIIRIKYFINDKSKDGGKFASIQGRMKKVDLINKSVIFTDSTCIALKSIVNIEKINIHDSDNLL